MRSEIIFRDVCDCYGHSPIFKKNRVLLQRGNIRIVAFTSSDGQQIYIYQQHKYLLIWWTVTNGKSISISEATEDNIMSLALEIMKMQLEREDYAKKSRAVNKGANFAKNMDKIINHANNRRFNKRCNYPKKINFAN